MNVGKSQQTPVGVQTCGQHYITEVNKGSIHMSSWQARLNQMYASGYRLAHVFEQDGNTVSVFEHAYHGWPS
jgi:hypothetical protein